MIYICMLLAAMGIEQPQPAVDVIPRPRVVEVDEGHLDLSLLRSVHAPESLGAVARYLADQLESQGGPRLAVVDGPPAPGSVVLSLDASASVLGEEGYRLTVGADQVRITGSGAAGVFYGVQSLIQMVAVAGDASIPGVTLNDRPRYRWRGLMLDCSRCFLHVDFVKRYIDLMAHYKLNVLHLHLTDDQGWRPFIEAYPDLTRIGSLHASNQNTEGGYYSKAEMREIVEYAASRYITVVPEIESPGHSMAALAAYPWLGCVGEGYDVPYRISVFPDVLCPGKESTYRFLEDVWTEILEIFPSEIVHLGGDEVPKIRWMECPDCQATMEREDLETPEELQSYFVGRVVDMLAEKGRRAIGWDEILEGGLAEGALVMSWRGTEGGIAAAEMGHDVVMSPTTYCYFDYPVNVTDLAKTYSYDPSPAELAPAEARHILGVQANMWTHLVPQSGIDGQVFPRLLALAEIGWSSADRAYPHFRSRVDEHLPWLDALGVDAGYPTFPALDSSREPAWTRPARIETTIETYMDYRPIRAFDGDTRDSFFWSARGLVEGDHFTLVLEEPMAARQLRVLTAHPPSGHTQDVLLDGVLEVSSDGERFEEVARFAGEGAEADLEGQRVRAVRIRCLADQVEWLIIREIELTAEPE